MPVAEMSPNSLRGLWFPILLLGIGASAAENLTGLLGESVMFQVKTSEPFGRIYWTKNNGSESRNISVVTFMEPCGLQVPLQDFETRVDAPMGCRKLCLRGLRKEDAGRYTAKIISENKEVEEESFELKVYRRLLESDLRVTCTSNGAESGTWQLHCSTETWEDGLELSWTSGSQNMNPTARHPEISLVYEEGDPDVTCTAKNRMSQASKRVSLKHVCAGASAVENLEGVLGESASFQVKTSKPFRMIYWTKGDGRESRNISVVTFMEPCGLRVLLQDFETRVDAPRGCRELCLHGLRKEDAGRYTAKIISENKEVEEESFELKVYRRLLESDLRVTCTYDEDESETWQLHCSTETWEDGLELSWTSGSQNMNPTARHPEISLVYEEGDPDVTCTAKNRVSQASKTVFLKDVCDGEDDELSGLPHWAKVLLSTLGSLLFSGSAGFIFMIKFRRGGGETFWERMRTASRRRQASAHVRPH